MGGATLERGRTRRCPDRVLRGLAAAGLRIVAADPSSALSLLHDHMGQRRRRAEAADDNDAGDGLGGEAEEDAEDIAA
jgi:hypothetical protein